MMKRNKKILIVVPVFILTAGVLFFMLKPRSLEIEYLTPSGALVFARLNKVQENLKALRSAKFFNSVSRIDLSRISKNDDDKGGAAHQWTQWQSRITGVIDHPVFKQVFNKETAIALYSDLDDFHNGVWPRELSGIVMFTRTNQKTRLIKSLAGIWNQFNQQWETQTSIYKDVVITSVDFQDPNPKIYYAFVCDVMVMAVDQRMLHKVIDTVTDARGSLIHDDLYVSLRKRLYESMDGFFYLDAAQSVEFLKHNWDAIFDKGLGQKVSSFSSNFKMFLDELAGTRAVAGAFLSGQPVQVKWIRIFDASKNEDGRQPPFGHCPAAEHKAVQWIPGDVLLYQWSNCFDFPAYYDWLKGLHQKETGELASAKSSLLELEESWGVSVEKDILPLLGNEMGWFIKGVVKDWLFPVPQMVLFLKITDGEAAARVLNKIMSTPITIIEYEQYRETKISSVVIPLVNALKPAYAIVGEYLLIATSDALIKQSVDVFDQLAPGLSEQAIYNELKIGKHKELNSVSFVKISEISRQSRMLVDWADQWFLRKMRQAEGDHQAALKQLEALSEKISGQEKNHADLLGKVDNLQKEKNSIDVQSQVSAVVMEAKDTLAQQGSLKQEIDSGIEEPQQIAESKKEEIEILHRDLAAMRRNIQFLSTQGMDLKEDLEDFDQQKRSAQNIHLYFEALITPVLEGLESLDAQSVVTINTKDGTESEMFLKAQ